MNRRWVMVASAGMLAMCGVLHAAGPSGEDAVYRAYLAALHEAKGFDDPRLLRFLSREARQQLADALAKPPAQNCNPCPSPAQTFELAKGLRPMPLPAIQPVRKTSDAGVTLTYAWHQPPGRDSSDALDVTVKVELVEEQGWKIKSDSWDIKTTPEPVR